MTAHKLATLGTAPAAVLEIHGRRWFERTNGNTYHSFRILVNGTELHYTPFAYGYGSQYAQNAQQWLVDHGYLDELAAYETLYGYCTRAGIQCINTVEDVPRKKDL